jgi:hypothetical protein
LVALLLMIDSGTVVVCLTAPSLVKIMSQVGTKLTPKKLTPKTPNGYAGGLASTVISNDGSRLVRSYMIE